MRAIPRVDDDPFDPAGMRQAMGCPAGPVAHDHGIGAHGLQGQSRVLQTLSLGDARALGAEGDDIG